METHESLEALKAKVGDLRRLARAETMERSEGPGRGSRVARISMMGGLDLELLPDRGMDIGATSWQGTPLAWVSPADAASPALLDPGSEGWRKVIWRWVAGHVRARPVWNRVNGRWKRSADARTSAQASCHWLSHVVQGGR